MARSSTRKGPKPVDPVPRFWAKVQVQDGCWPWIGARHSAGYGSFSVRHGQIIVAHRFSYELHFGPIPSGLHICHRCDNRICVNPAHLFAGTRSDNMSDCARKGRMHPYPRHGTANPRAKLDEESVRAIRQLIADGVSDCAVARRFGVRSQTIYKVRLHLTWGHVL